MSDLTTDTPGLDLAVQKYQEFNADEKLRELAFFREKAERDRLARVAYLKNQYIKEGIVIGETLGEQRGIAIGEERGTKKGRKEGEGNMLFSLWDMKFGQENSDEFQLWLTEAMQTVNASERFAEAQRLILQASSPVEVLRRIQEK